MQTTSEASTIASGAKAVAHIIAGASTELKDRALTAMAEALLAAEGDILKANGLDVAAAEAEVEAGKLGEAFVDRLRLTPQRLRDMADALKEIVQLQDPVGATVEEWRRPNGLRVARRRIPLGVICMIYEARPNVTSDAAALCLKAGNAVVLRGGRRALKSNLAVVAALHAGLESVGLPKEIVSFVGDPDRGLMAELIKQDQALDLVIPRGGEGLIRFVAENASVPVLKHYKGVCHVFVDEFADLDKAEAIVLNGKMQKPSACNSVETILLHDSIAHEAFERLGRALLAAGATLHVEPSLLQAADKSWVTERVVPADESDYAAEYLSTDVAITTVSGVAAAAAHIRKYGSDHTECIVTENYTRANAFVDSVLSSVVTINASTRFADGGQLGLGAEIGISTTRMHAYGPMGLNGLTSARFVVFGDGQVRQ